MFFLLRLKPIQGSFTLIRLEEFSLAGEKRIDQGGAVFMVSIC